MNGFAAPFPLHLCFYISVPNRLYNDNSLNYNLLRVAFSYLFTQMLLIKIHHQPSHWSESQHSPEISGDFYFFCHPNPIYIERIVFSSFLSLSAKLDDEIEHKELSIAFAPRLHPEQLCLPPHTLSTECTTC